METTDCPGCQEWARRYAELEARVLTLEAQLRDLMDKLKPPTAKPHEPLPKGKAKVPTGKTRGGQTGHPPHLKSWLPRERVTAVVNHEPTACSACAASLAEQPNLPQPKIHQVIELPRHPLSVTEHQGHRRTCACGAVTAAAIPADLRQHTIGPRLAAAMSCLVGLDGLSKRSVENTLATVFGVDVSLGTISNTEAAMSAALEAPYQEARQAVANAAVKGLDETGWKEAGKKRWLWTGIAAKLSVVVFLIHPRRNLDALKHLLGGDVSGQVITDRWSIYLTHLDEDEHQLCWAHLKRNWEKQADRTAPAKRLADRWFELHKTVFQLWHRFGAGDFDREDLQRRLNPTIAAVSELLGKGSRSRDAALARFCTRLLEVVPRLWLFVLADGVPPTNNDAERVQRRAVIWRRRSFGCASPRGCRFVERLLTVSETLRMQGRNVLDYLQLAVQNYRNKNTAPALLMAQG